MNNFNIQRKNTLLNINTCLLTIFLFLQPAICTQNIDEQKNNEIKELIEHLKYKDDSVRWYAAEALGRIGPDAKESVPALIDALKKDKDDYVRGAADEVLGRIGPDAKKAVPALIGALKDKDDEVRGAADEALGKIR